MTPEANRILASLVRRARCPLHPEAPRPCDECYTRAIRQRDAQRRQETAALHAGYLAAEKAKRKGEP